MPVTSIDEDGYEPLVIEGTPTGEIHWIREGVAGLWRVLPGQLPVETPYVFHRTETLQVLEGSVEIIPEDGEPVAVGIGEIVSFPAGTNSTWRIEMPFRKFFVHS